MGCVFLFIIVGFGRLYGVFGVYEGLMKAIIAGRSRANRNEDPAPGASPQPFLAEALDKNHETIVLRTLRPRGPFTIFNPSESSEPGAGAVECDAHHTQSVWPGTSEHGSCSVYVFVFGLTLNPLGGPNARPLLNHIQGANRSSHAHTQYMIHEQQPQLS